MIIITLLLIGQFTSIADLLWGNFTGYLSLVPATAFAFWLSLPYFPLLIIWRQFSQFRQFPPAQRPLLFATILLSGTSVIASGFLHQQPPIIPLDMTANELFSSLPYAQLGISLPVTAWIAALWTRQRFAIWRYHRQQARIPRS